MKHRELAIHLTPESLFAERRKKRAPIDNRSLYQIEHSQLILSMSRRGERRSPLRGSIQADRQALPSGSHAERPVQGSRRKEYWAADAGGPRAQQASKLETRALFGCRHGDAAGERA